MIVVKHQFLQRDVLLQRMAQDIHPFVCDSVPRKIQGDQSHIPQEHVAKSIRSNVSHLIVITIKLSGLYTERRRTELTRFEKALKYRID